MTSARTLRARARAKAWRRANPQRAKENHRRWRAANKDKLSRWGRRWRLANRDKTRQYSAAWRRNNPEKMRACIRAWARTYPERRAVVDANRRARKLAATVPLSKAERDKVRRFYVEARRLTKSRGEPYHVDHIKPLVRGGLHHPSNMQVLRGVENLKKGAR